MDDKTASDTRPVFDDLNPEMFIGIWEQLPIADSAQASAYEQASEYSHDASAWDY